MLLIVSVAEPELVIVTGCAALVVFTAWLLKERLEAERLTTGVGGGFIPTPVRLTSCGLSGASSWIMSVPFFGPMTVGLNVRLMVQVAEGASTGCRAESLFTLNCGVSTIQ